MRGMVSAEGSGIRLCLVNCEEQDRYDATKLEYTISWRADENFDNGIVKTIEWYLEKCLEK